MGYSYMEKKRVIHYLAKHSPVFYLATSPDSSLAPGRLHGQKGRVSRKSFDQSGMISLITKGQTTGILATKNETWEESQSILMTCLLEFHSSWPLVPSPGVNLEQRAFVSLHQEVQCSSWEPLNLWESLCIQSQCTGRRDLVVTRSMYWQLVCLVTDLCCKKEISQIRKWWGTRQSRIEEQHFRETGKRQGTKEKAL